MRSLVLMVGALLLASCGGGSSPNGVTPTPGPTLSPGPAPSPAPTPTPAALSYIHDFTAAVGEQPNGPLIQARDGNFYGTTGSGGAFGTSQRGTVFRLTPGGVKTMLHSFGPDIRPSNPTGGLIEGNDGALYGLTIFGRTNFGGSIFRITLP